MGSSLVSCNRDEVMLVSLMVRPRSYQKRALPTELYGPLSLYKWRG
jgi:hypothetical protein